MGKNKNKHLNHKGSTIFSDEPKQHQTNHNKFRSGHFDFYSVEPLYQWNPISSRVSKAVTLINLAIVLAYMVGTLSVYLVTPPSLVQRSTYNIPAEADVEVYELPAFGISVQYNDMNGDSHMLTANNRDRYFSFQILAVNYTEQPSLCRNGTISKDCVDVVDEEEIIPCEDVFPDYRDGTFCIDPAKSNKYSIQGDYVLKKYGYVNFVLNRCVNNTEDISLATASNNPPVTCASPEEIAKVVQSGSVAVGLIVQGHSFDPEQFHQQKDPLKPADISWRWFLQPGVSKQNEVYMKPRQVRAKNRWLDTDLGFDFFERTKAIQFLDSPAVLTYNRPLGEDPTDQTEYLEFFVRVDRTGTRSEVVYDYDILTLVSLWGALYSVLANITLGQLARMYNNYVFKKHFKKSAENFAHQDSVAGSIVHDNETELPDWKQKQEGTESFADLSLAEEGLAHDKGTYLAERAQKQGTAVLKVFQQLGLIYNNDLELAEKKKKQGTAARKIFQQMQNAFNDMDLRLMDAKNLDCNGQLTITPEELLHPTSVFGELRIMALLEHAKKQGAASKICAFYRQHRKKLAQKDARPEDNFSAMPSARKSLCNYHLQDGGIEHEEDLSENSEWQLEKDMSKDNHHDTEESKQSSPQTYFGSSLDAIAPWKKPENHMHTTADYDPFNERSDVSSNNQHTEGALQPPPKTNLGFPLDASGPWEVPEAYTPPPLYDRLPQRQLATDASLENLPTNEILQLPPADPPDTYFDELEVVSYFNV